MKLATLNSGRDGELVVVSRDLTRAVRATDIAATLQQAIEDWDTLAPRLEARYAELNAGTAEGDFALEMAALHSPLPRTYRGMLRRGSGRVVVHHVNILDDSGVN